MPFSNIDQIFQRFQSANPNPKTELHYVNDYTLLVAVVLSAQATDVSVNKATAQLFDKVITPQAMLDLGLDALKGHLKTLNYYPTKAKNVMALSQILVDQYQGHVPDTREALEALPGVGRKTANVVLNVAFSQPTLAVDTHIFRLANRLGFVHTKTPLETEQALLPLIPEPMRHNAHHWLILHGRYICKAKKPQCAHCFLQDLCPYPHKEIP